MNLPNLEKEWVAIVGVGVGGVLTGLFGFLNGSFTHWRGVREKRREEKIRLLEEVIAASDSARNALNYLYTNLSAALLFKDPEPAKTLKMPDFPLSRLELIVRLRFPLLGPSLTEIVKAHEGCSEAFMTAFHTYATGDESGGQRHLVLMMEKVKTFGDMCNRLKDEAIVQGKQIL